MGGLPSGLSHGLVTKKLHQSLSFAFSFIGQNRALFHLVRVYFS